MNIKELLKSEEYKLLLINAKEKQAEFYAFEEKETIKRDNLEKHKKILSALETESDDIEQQLKNIDITDNSVSIDDNFKLIDDLNFRLSANSHKIKAIKKAIEKSELDRKIFFDDDYVKTLDNANSATTDVMRQYESAVYNDLLPDNIISKLVQVYYQYGFKNDDSIEQYLEKLTDKIRTDIKALERAEVPDVVGVNHITPLYPIRRNNGIVQKREIEKLKQHLDQL